MSGIRDPKSRVTQFAYDHLGRQVSRTLPMSQSESQTYDSFGRLATKLDFKGQKTELTYDTLGRVETKRLYATGAGSPSKVYCYSYDELGRQKKIVELQGSGLTNSCAAVAFGLVPPPTYTFAAVAGRWGGKHSFGLTLVLGLLCSLLFLILLGRERTQRTQEFGPLNTRITRKVLALTRWRPLAYLAGPILILCDLCASVVHAVRWMLSVERWMLSVESVHPPSSILDPRSTSRFRLRLFPVWVKALTIWTIISLLGTESNWELLAANCPTGQTPIDDTVRVTEFPYDVDGRVTSVCSPEGTIHYEYDAATGRKTRMYTDNNDTRYTYDELGRLKTVAVHKKNGQPVSPAEVTTYNYTDVGSRESVEMANGTKTTYEYNDLKRLTKVSILDSQSSILSSFAYTLHATGRRTASTEITRQDDSSYTTNNFTWSYDQMYRLVSEVRGQGSEDQATDSYVYDLVGNRLSKNTESPVSGLLSSVSYSYNANDQLLQEVSTVTGTTTYSYDANGSQVQKSGDGDPAPTTYTYDLENRLSAAGINRVEDGQTVNIVASYVYNPFGIRTRADTTTIIGSGQPTTRSKLFLVDSMNHTGYAQVLEEKDASGSLEMSYTIGDDVLAQTSGPPTHYLGYDGHGSTRILTDGNGAIASGGRYNYDAYGVSLDSQPSTLNPSLTSLLYTGEQFDTGLQQYYLRARYYNQSAGRFNSLDPFGGNSFAPESLHKYAYAHGDPANGLDPSGELTTTEILVVSGIIGFLGGYIYGHFKDSKNAFRYGLYGAAAGVVIAASVIFVGIAGATIAGVSEGTGIAVAGVVTNFGSGIYNIIAYARADNPVDRTAALIGLAANIVGVAIPAVGYARIAAGRGTFQNAAGGTTANDLLEAQAGEQLANFWKADITRKPPTPGAPSGPETADYHFSFRDAGKTAELKDIRTTPWDNVQSRLTTAQSENVVAVVKEGQFAELQLAKIPGRVMGPNAPGSVKSVTVMEELPGGKGLRVLYTETKH